MIKVQLPQFEGPMDLLLFLIRKEEMSIFDINILEITTQYFNFIKMMREFDLEVAAEFITMAATLLQIKSRMLLPQYDDNGEVIEGEDPRKELVQKLLEYQKYQEGAQLLNERALLGRDAFLRGGQEQFEKKPEEIVIEENGLFTLISAYRVAIRRVKNKVHQVAAKLQSIASRISELSTMLILNRRVPFSDLITASDSVERKKQILITFLSLLELGKMSLVRLFQTDDFQEIHIEAVQMINYDSIGRVEEYEKASAETTGSPLGSSAHLSMV